jgi:AraC-like DNA-binding protein
VLDQRDPASLRPLSIDAGHAAALMFTGAMAYDPINRGMWIGCNEGVYFYRFATNTLEEPFTGCRNIRGCIGSVVTQDGFLLMGCTEGMIRIDLRSRPTGKGFFKTQQLRYKLDDQGSGIIDKIMSFCKAADGSVWIGSNGYGLYHMTYDRNRQPVFRNYTSAHGLPNNVVKGVAQGRDGLLWITTAHGLSRFDPRTGSFSNFDESEGLLSSEFYFNSAVSGGDGKIYLGTVKGLVELDGQNHTNAGVGQLRFTSLTVNNQEVAVGQGYLDEDISIARKIRLHESDKSLTIYFAALNYGSETQGVYSYRLKGLEDEWTQLPPGQHSVRYSSLTGGNYEFQVRYTPTLGTGHVQTASIAIDVTPYFWKSWWFFTLLLLVIAAGGYVAYNRRLQHIREAEAEKLYRPIEVALKESENPDMLQTRIQNILHNEQRYKESQVKSVMADKEEVARSTKPFMDQVIAVLEANFSNSEFGSAELSTQLGMSRNVLNRKLSAEIGYTASQFIRNYRLDFARKLLMENFADRNITEIAYKSGFNDPKYFTRCFTKQYGTAPSNYKSEA